VLCGVGIHGFRGRPQRASEPYVVDRGLERGQGLRAKGGYDPAPDVHNPALTAVRARTGDAARIVPMLGD